VNLARSPLDTNPSCAGTPGPVSVDAEEGFRGLFILIVVRALGDGGDEVREAIGQHGRQLR
jgi:hypothetical protein